jgi:hypothetical protein
MISATNLSAKGGGPMFLIPLVVVFVVIALLVIVGPALLPLAVVAGIVFAAHKGVEHHRHRNQGLHTH